MATLNNIKFDSNQDGSLFGQLYFANGYGVYIAKSNISIFYELYILRKINYNLWITDMDDNMLSISSTNDLIELTEEQVNVYLLQVESLSVVIPPMTTPSI